jgi:energy-coupling factor transport system ATP-binding protein
MIRFSDFSFCYEGMSEPALKHIDLEIKEGEFLLITGRSGCGKSTLLRSLNGLIPHFYPGEYSGDLLIEDNSLLKMQPSEIAGKIGTVFQDPRSQFFMTDTTRELAFGCENMGYKREEIIDRVEKAVIDLELEQYLNRSIFLLSSGEKQQIAIGSVYALNPDVYIFDEPSANLDHEAAKRLTGIMEKLKNAGYTVIVADHRFYYLRELIDRVVYIEEGRIVSKFSGNDFCNCDTALRRKMGLRTVYPEKEIDEFLGITSYVSANEKAKKYIVSDLSFGYNRKDNTLDNISLEAMPGDVIGIIGHNGVGKTTLISVLTGILKEKSGTVYYDGRRLSAAKRRKHSYLVMQDADYQLFASSVEEELTLGIDKYDDGLLENTLGKLALSEYRDKHPASLSGGQKQRVTIGASLLKKSEILFFDEPTSGLDYDSMMRVSSLIQELAHSGAIAFIVSHDFEFIMHSCTKIFDLDAAEGERLLNVSKDYMRKLAERYFA